MTDLAQLSYLHHNHPLLAEVQEREFEIARLRRQIAAADARIARLQATQQRILAAAQRRREAQPA